MKNTKIFVFIMSKMCMFTYWVLPFSHQKKKIWYLTPSAFNVFFPIGKARTCLRFYLATKHSAQCFQRNREIIPSTKKRLTCSSLKIALFKELTRWVFSEVKIGSHSGSGLKGNIDFGKEIVPRSSTLEVTSPSFENCCLYPQTFCMGLENTVKE